MFKSTQLVLGISALLCSVSRLMAVDLMVSAAPTPGAVTIAGPTAADDATIIVDTNDFPVVQLAANFFADDVQRVTGRRLIVTNSLAGAQAIIVGTLGHSAVIDRLAADGKLTDLDKIRGRWEATLWAVVDHPLPGVERALVIVGSDRRGTAYGLTQLSEKIGVSPWYWWADVPPRHRDTTAVNIPAPQVDAPGVRYRGIFINDEDWGLNPWASKTFDPKFGNIGPKTYERVFELMLRLRLNYLWPAMHACSTAFGSVPENAALADKFGIVMGASHCEPMLYNNVKWNEQTQGRWNYARNRDTIHETWSDAAKARGQYEAVWTLGIRGIHDRPMETPPNNMPDKISLMTGILGDQRKLLDDDVTKQWGPVAQCFVPYKEVLPIYDAGLKVPDDVTLVWVDDNFGYIRRFSDSAERKRSGGAGVYWHISYYGGPHSYTWINTTAPALMWEELYKAWGNDARTLWMLNVGDIKPMEIGIDYYSRLAWNPEGFHLGGQSEFLENFVAKNFGETPKPPPVHIQMLPAMLKNFYWLGTIRKPELMDRTWALSLSPKEAADLQGDYQSVLKLNDSVSSEIPANARDAYTEMIGFPARVLAETGLIFMADRNVQLGIDVTNNQNKITALRKDLEAQVENFNTKIAGGKWNHIMPGLVTGQNLDRWNSQVRWPWGEKTASTNQSAKIASNNPPAGQSWRDAADADGSSSGASQWYVIEGLGPSGRAVVLEPTVWGRSWDVSGPLDGKTAPTLEYDFDSNGGDAAAYLDFLPTFRIYPGMKLRVAVSVDDGAPTVVEVPGSSGAENETGTIRSDAVQNNYARVRIPLPHLAKGHHTFIIRAVDPGAVIDRVSLPRQS
jgi:hypothetical protein